MTGLAERLRPCGPVVDAEAVGRTRLALEPVADREGWRSLLDLTWPSLEPVFAASPYLAGLARRHADGLRQSLEDDPSDRLEGILATAEALDGGVEAVRVPLRRLKADLHLLTALADLGGVWDLEAVTSALSRFADVATRQALAAVAFDQRAQGRLLTGADDARGPVPGLFGLAMGKHGAHELNYSSDIDLSLFFEPDVLGHAVAPGVEVQAFVNRVAKGLAGLLSERTGDGYVFRVDLRLRPDASSTPPVVAVPYALDYYEGVGQNWERAAFIKARVVCGDVAEGEAFLRALQPFIWRRSLDYPAILDIQSIKRQIHAHKTGEGLEAAGANLKLGRGGIREIEFYVQTQQLILGGRDAGLRSPRTVEALADLAKAGHVSDAVAEELRDAYEHLRALEHRTQMIDDAQTHTLPPDPLARAAIAALAGEDDLSAFDARVTTMLARVNQRYGELFEGGEDLSSPFGSLVFTGVENDPETLLTLERMGFSEPAGVADTIRAWHHGRIPATRSARGRELFTRLAPRLLTALAETGAPDDAFHRFAVFFSGLSAGVQVQALFLNQPRLFALVVGVMAFAPRLARMLGRYPTAMDSILDDRFHTELGTDTGLFAQMDREARAAEDFEGAMNAVRRLHREQDFRIGIQTLSGRVGPEAAGLAYTNLADAVMRTLAEAALRETMRIGGAFPGQIAVIALGKAGSREMTAASDLDIMTVYHAEPGAVSEIKGWSAETWGARFTQRLVAALSAHTAAGSLYEVDMRLRPSGSKGPVSVSLAALSGYYGEEAATWEYMALTRARVVWASDPALSEQVSAALLKTLRRPRQEVDLAHDVRSMRALMERERPAAGFWDLKLSPGGQVDAEFLGQFLQLREGPEGGDLTVSTLRQLDAWPQVAESWRLHQRVGQWLACAFDGPADPDAEAEPFQARLAAAAGGADFGQLKSRLAALRQVTRASLEAATIGVSDGDRDASR